MDSNTQDGSTDSTATSADIAKTVQIANILRASRRIQVLLELYSASEYGMTVGSLADAIPENEPASESPNARRSAYIALSQSHLPKLESERVIAWDRDTVTRPSRFNEMVSALHRLQECGLAGEFCCGARHCCLSGEFTACHRVYRCLQILLLGRCRVYRACIVDRLRVRARGLVGGDIRRP